MDRQQARKFVFAGSAHFTVVGNTKRYTFRVRTPTKQHVPGYTVHFVHMLTGPDDYTYVGTVVDEQHFQGRLKAPEALKSAARWVFKHGLQSDEAFASAEFYHEGRCGRCARMLTTPESIKAGFGPKCASL